MIINIHKVVHHQNEQGNAKLVCLFLEICLFYLTAQPILSVTICLFLDERRSMTIRNLESAVSYSISVYALNDRGRGNNPFSFVASTLEPRTYLCDMFNSCCSLPLAIHVVSG